MTPLPLPSMRPSCRPRLHRVSPPLPPPPSAMHFPLHALSVGDRVVLCVCAGDEAAAAASAVASLWLAGAGVWLAILPFRHAAHGKGGLPGVSGPLLCTWNWRCAYGCGGRGWARGSAPSRSGAGWGSRRGDGGNNAVETAPTSGACRRRARQQRKGTVTAAGPSTVGAGGPSPDGGGSAAFNGCGAWNTAAATATASSSPPPTCSGGGQRRRSGAVRPVGLRNWEDDQCQRQRQVLLDGEGGCECERRRFMAGGGDNATSPAVRSAGVAPSPPIGPRF